MKTQKELRVLFWLNHPEYLKEFRTRKRHNEYSTDIRVAFCQFLDHLHRDGRLHDSLAERAVWPISYKDLGYIKTNKR